MPESKDIKKQELNPEEKERREEEKAQKIFEYFQKSGLIGEEVFESHFTNMIRAQAALREIGFNESWTRDSEDIETLISVDLLKRAFGRYFSSDELYKKRSPREIKDVIIKPLIDNDKKIFFDKDGTPCSFVEYLNKNYEGQGVDLNIEEQKMQDVLTFGQEADLFTLAYRNAYPGDKKGLIQLSKFIHGEIEREDISSDNVAEFFKTTDYATFLDTPVLTLRFNGKEFKCPIYVVEEEGGDFVGKYGYRYLGYEGETENIIPFFHIILNCSSRDATQAFKMINNLVHEIDHAVYDQIARPTVDTLIQREETERIQDGEDVEKVLFGLAKIREGMKEEVANDATMKESLAEKAKLDFQYLQTLGAVKLDQALRKLKLTNTYANNEPGSEAFNDYQTGPLMAVYLQEKGPEKYDKYFLQREFNFDGIDYLAVQKKLTDKILRAREEGGKKMKEIATKVIKKEGKNK